MSAPVRFRITGDETGRADKVVAARYPRLGRRQIARLFADGSVRVDGRRARKGDFVAAGAEVELDHEPARDDATPPAPAAEIDLEVLYTDAALVAVNKPAGAPSHPLRAGERGTLANALVAAHPECADAGAEAREGGLAHRLDTDTSGVILAARSPEAWRRLREQFETGSVDKVYLALVPGRIADRGRCDAPLAQRGDHVVVSYDDDGLGATTEWQVLERVGEHALVRCRTRSGRMHQVRAHLGYRGAPIVGDRRYGGDPGPPVLVGHFLHAERITLPHPTESTPLSIDAPLPADRRACLEALRAPD